jgi:hypothetical protein
VILRNYYTPLIKKMAAVAAAKKILIYCSFIYEQKIIYYY